MNHLLFNKIVSINIERIIQNKRISKNELEELAGISSEKLDLLYSGKIDWELNFILKIYKNLEVDIKEIIPNEVSNNEEDKNISYTRNVD